MILDTDVRVRLERLALQSRRRVRSRWSGRHRSTQLGESLDFADYREYAPGDDFRRIDHNLHARLGVLLVRLFEAEQELPLRVILDRSGSMEDKYSTSQQLAAALLYMALSSGDRAQVLVTPGHDGPLDAGPAGRHGGAWPGIEAWLETYPAEGESQLHSAARFLASSGTVRGPVAIISDLLTPDWGQAIDTLGAIGGGAVVHVLSDEELQPTYTGDLRLRDRETGRTADVSISESAIARYRSRRDEFLENAAARSRKAGLDYVLVAAGPDALDTALRDLLTAGVIR